jgi:hypothetical protein
VKLKLGGSRFEASPGKYFLRAPPISKITTARWTGDVAQAIQPLLCKWESQSSNPSPTKNRQKLLLYWPTCWNNSLNILVQNYCLLFFFNLSL